MRSIDTRGVTAMLRIKNERKICTCLESIYDLFDELVIIDNGSTDQILGEDCRRLCKDR
ncbi:MAG: hypothetical protein U0992_04465 [Planctomycetaceae bacterium]